MHRELGMVYRDSRSLSRAANAFLLMAMEKLGKSKPFSASIPTPVVPHFSDAVGVR